MNKNIGTIEHLVIEREFDAPADLVWKLWTDPEHFKNWYGPEGISVPVARFDLRVGGERTVCMEMPAPEGPRRMWSTGEHTEISPTSRLVYTDSIADERGNIVTMEGHPTTTEVTVALEAVGRKTRLVLTHAGISAESPGAAGWQQALDKLAAHLMKVGGSS